MPKMGDLAAQDSYSDVDWSRMNQPFGQLLDPNPKLYDTKAGPIYQADINQAIDVGMGVSGGGLATKGIKAYHSSPHDFDKFDFSFRHGEGARAYGEGGYFAENPAVSGQGGEYWKQFQSRFPGSEGSAAELLKRHKFDREAALAANQREIDQYIENYGNRLGKDKWHDRVFEEMQGRDKLLRSDKPIGPRTYEVDIKADPAHMLDWDKPLEKQSVWDRIHPEVRNTIDDVMDERGMNVMSDVLETYTGKELYKALKHHDVHEALPPELPGSSWYTGATTEAKHTAAYLESLGIPGIKYLDQVSRGASPYNIIPTGQGNYIVRGNRYSNMADAQQAKAAADAAYETERTSNYVIFNPNIIDIMKRYGIAGAAPAAMSALAAQDSYQPEEKM